MTDVRATLDKYTVQDGKEIAITMTCVHNADNLIRLASIGAGQPVDEGSREMSIPVHIDCFSDPGVYRIQSRGKTYLFDFSDRFGPSKCNKNGDICKNPCHPGHVLVAITHWRNQGKRVDENSLCIWEEPPRMDLSNHVQVGKSWFPKQAIVDFMEYKERSRK